MDHERKMSRDEAESVRERHNYLFSEEAIETEGKMIDNKNNEDQDRSGESNGNPQEQSEFKENIEECEENVNDGKKNRMHAKVDSENVSDSNEYFQKVKTVEILVSFWGLLQIGNSIIIYEVLTTNSDGSKDSFVKQSLAISTLTSIGLTISIFLRHIAHLKWKRSKLFCLKDETIWSSGYWKVMVIEAIFTTIAPQFFLNNIVISEYIAKYDVVVVEYEVNTVLCCFVWMKCYVVVRTLLTMTKFLSPRSQRICKMNGCDADMMFSVQGEFKQSPNTILISTLIISVLIFGYNIRIFEAPLSEVSGQRFDSYYYYRKILCPVPLNDRDPFSFVRWGTGQRVLVFWIF